MTLSERTLRLGDEYDRLDSQLDAYVDRVQDGDDVQTIHQLASECQARLAGISYLVDKYGADATVTITGLTAGEFARVEDRVAKKREQSAQDSLPGYHRNVYATVGLADAPFYDPGADFDDQLATVANRPVGVVKWLQSRIDDETSVAGEDFRSFGERLAASSEE